MAISHEHEQTIYDFLVRLRSRMHLRSVRRPRSRISLLAVVSARRLPRRCSTAPAVSYYVQLLAVPTGTSVSTAVLSRRRTRIWRVSPDPRPVIGVMVLSVLYTYTSAYDSFS